MIYKDERNDKYYLLNLIDTPGHIDFSYEVSRSLASCQGALLLVDSSQSIQAQTLANHSKAKILGLNIIPVVTKIDLPNLGFLTNNFMSPCFVDLNVIKSHVNCWFIF